MAPAQAYRQRVEPGPTGSTPFYEDRRALWRVTWTLGLALVLVCVLMAENGAWPWPIFAGLAALLLGIGGAALLQRSKPMLRVEPEGLRVFAGAIGLGGQGDASEFLIPWAAVDGIAFERRRIGRQTFASVLAFHVVEDVPRPDGHRGFLAKLAERRSQWALGEHMIWNPDTRKLDLSSLPRGGMALLTAAIAERVPRLGDPSADRRPGIGGPFAYALFDFALAAAVVLCLALVVTGETQVFGQLARLALEWGGRVRLDIR